MSWKSIHLFCSPLQMKSVAQLPMSVLLYKVSSSFIWNQNMSLKCSGLLIAAKIIVISYTPRG